MTDKPDLKIINFPYKGLQNVSEMMRALAQAIDDGEYGKWQQCVLVMNAETEFTVFGWGLDSASDACMICAAGVERFTQTLTRRQRK